MLQTQSALFEWLIGMFVLVFCSAVITYVLRRTPRFMENGSTGRLAAWWRWINTPISQDYKQRVHTPKRTFVRQVESWSCPICGSDLTPDDAEKINLGYNIECEYCGATIGSPY